MLIFCFYSSSYGGVNFLTISDIHYGVDNLSQEGKDTGPEFLKITLKKFNKLSKNVNFILLLGDLPTHFLFNSSKKSNYEKTVFDELYANDSGKPIFYITGNNDSLIGNYQPFESNGVSPLTFATHWNGACAHCEGLIIDKSHMYHDGYYSSYVIHENKKIILIALNANQWTKAPFPVSYPNQDKDALTQFSWLEQQLKTHHSEQLLIAMHEPPGNSYRGHRIWHKRYKKKFIKILNENKNLYGEITLLTSHTHMDEFRKIHFNDDDNIYAYSTPSISRLHHNYPGMKVFSLNKAFRIKNFTTFYTSYLDKWENQNYQALNSPNAIFSNCQNTTLAQCLNRLSDKQVCAYVNKGLFYGVKSPIVPNNMCKKIYLI